MGVLAGAVVGVSFGVLLIILIIWLVFRKKEKKKYEEEETPNEIRSVIFFFFLCLFIFCSSFTLFLSNVLNTEAKHQLLCMCMCTCVCVCNKSLIVKRSIYWFLRAILFTPFCSRAQSFSPLQSSHKQAAGPKCGLRPCLTPSARFTVNWGLQAANGAAYYSRRENNSLLGGYVAAYLPVFR